ncbi:MAG TPA: CHAD domain-containing protein [Chthoniobacterales bacterium]|jgi:CHAD domain-containing protein|nr:CHAD domain-containing protein [Chthoniobacterales bacterium]
MSYQLRPDETLGDGLRRIIRRQIENAICASKAKQNGKDSPVHETRKHLKKARAALRLVRGEVKKKAWKREDRCLAQVGQMISDVRDAEVRLETVRQLRGFMRGKKRSFEETEELLAFELDSFLAAFSEWPQEAEARLGETLERLQDWPLQKLDCKRLRRNVQRTYKCGRRDLEAAIEHMTTETLHVFRKRAKELSHQMRILRPLAPAVFGELNDELKTIGECLGQLHDLAFVSQRLWSFGAAERQGDRILSALIAVRTDELRSTAIALAERFYAERPRQFARRISRYFSEWEIARARCLAPNGTRVGALS